MCRKCPILVLITHYLKESISQLLDIPCVFARRLFMNANIVGCSVSLIIRRARSIQFPSLFNFFRILQFNFAIKTQEISLSLPLLLNLIKDCIVFLVERILLLLLLLLSLLYLWLRSSIHTHKLKCKLVVLNNSIQIQL